MFLLHFSTLCNTTWSVLAIICCLNLPVVKSIGHIDNDCVTQVQLCKYVMNLDLDATIVTCSFDALGSSWVPAQNHTKIFNTNCFLSPVSFLICNLATHLCERERSDMYQLPFPLLGSPLGPLLGLLLSSASMRCIGAPGSDTSLLRVAVRTSTVNLRYMHGKSLNHNNYYATTYKPLAENGLTWYIFTHLPWSFRMTVDRLAVSYSHAWWL